MKILETERLYVREFEEYDLDKMAEIYSDDEVMKCIGRAGLLINHRLRECSMHLRTIKIIVII